MNSTGLQDRILNVDAAQLSTAIARAALVAELTDSGFCDRGRAEKLVDVLSREAAGEPIPPEIAEFLRKQRELLREYTEGASELDEAFAAFYGLEALRDRRKVLIARIDLEHALLMTLSSSLEPESVARNYERRLAAPHASREDLAANLGAWIAGAREMVAVLENRVIPQLKKEVAALDAEIAAAAPARPAKAK